MTQRSFLLSKYRDVSQLALEAARQAIKKIEKNETTFLRTTNVLFASTCTRMAKVGNLDSNLIMNKSSY